MKNLDVTKDLLSRLNLKIQSPMSEPFDDARAQPKEDYTQWRLAASVLQAFNPEALRPLGGGDPGAPASWLAAEAIPAPGGRAEGLWTLKESVRRDGLHDLGSTSRMLAAIQANPERPRTDLQGLFEATLRGEASEDASRSYDDLSNALQIRGWLGDLVPGEKVEDLSSKLAARSLVSAFEHLIGRELIGRKRELETLRSYCDSAPPNSQTASSRLEAASRRVNQWLGVVRRPPLVVYGPGGIGKSALVGKLLIEQTELPEADRLPFAYLGLDQPTLRADEPFTLIVEITRQLELQYVGDSRVSELMRSTIINFRTALFGADSRRTQSKIRQERVGRYRRARGGLYEGIGTAISQSIGEKHMLLVFDTFEEALYQPRAALEEFVAMLEGMQSTLPRLRVIISGRAPLQNLRVSGREPESLALDDLPRQDRIALLRNEGIEDGEVLEAIADQIGGNPLNLKLAARSVSTHSDLLGERGISDLRTKKFFIFQLSPDLIRGQLYRRVLGHIKDEDVRKLAHPGMVLRRVTADLIERVLAEPCDVDVSTPGRAEELFARLRVEHALVDVSEGESLVFRPEVRKPVLQMLTQDKPDQVQNIHRRAAEYYSQSAELRDRAEFVYHRLSLEEFGDGLESIFDKDLVPLLAGSLDELPKVSQAWLADHGGVTVPASIAAAARGIEAERLVARDVASCLRRLDIERANKLLAKGPPHTPGGPLDLLEAKAHLLQQSYDEALTVLNRALDAFPPEGNVGRFAELLCVRAQAKELLGLANGADEDLARLQASVGLFPDPITLVHVLTHRMLLRREPTWAQSGDADRDSLRALLAHQLSTMDLGALDRYSALARLAAGVLTPGYPAAIRRIVESIGVGDFVLELDQKLEFAKKLEALGPRFADAVKTVEESGSIERLVYRVIQPETSDGSPETRDRAIAALLDVLAPPTSSLASVNLPGLDSYRENWELEQPETEAA